MVKRGFLAVFVGGPGYLVRPLLPVAGGQLAETVDVTTAESYFRSNPEVFGKLLTVG